MKVTTQLFAFAVMAVAMISCNKEMVPAPQADEEMNRPALTKAYGDKTPKIAVYVETNDVNPLNAGDYYLDDGSQFVDIVELFAANIHMDAYGDPCIYLNDKLTNVLENGGVDTYVRPLQAKGIKVVLTTLGDWDEIGVANMTDAQAEIFAEILAYMVNHYGLDGIGFDDEYTGTSATVSGSFGRVISKLRPLIPGKLITVFQYGHYNQISSSDAANIDYVYSDFGWFNEECSISGVGKSKFAPYSINLGTYSSYMINTYKTYAAKAANEGYGALMYFNLRTTSDKSPLPVFDAMAEGAFGQGAYVSGGDRPRTAGSVPGGFTITYDDI